MNPRKITIAAMEQSGFEFKRHAQTMICISTRKPSKQSL